MGSASRAGRVIGDVLHLNKPAVAKASYTKVAPEGRGWTSKRKPLEVARRKRDRATDRKAKFKESKAPAAKFFRHQRVTSRTQDTYKAIVDRFYQEEGLKRSDDAAVLDAALTRRILKMYLDGEAIGTARYLAHVLKWDKGVETKAFPKALAALAGHKNVSHEPT